MRPWLRLLRALPLLLVSPLLVLLPAVLLCLTDLLWAVFGRKKLPADTRPDTRAVSVVIPNWNGRDLLEKYVPSVLAALEDHPGSELIVVDNGSEDGSAEFLKQHFPTVRVLALPRNLGFGGGSNAGFQAARHDVVVLLNSDMRVDRHFVQPLLDGFTDEAVFAVSCQIFFSDPAKLREETGLTQGWWSNGMLRVRHRVDEEITGLFPCFYGGGGSCAFDRRKFLELGGFDELLAPFYLEDTDLGYLAWKRGWKVLYQPQSVVFHEHRGTIGRKFSPAFIQGILKKNFLLFCWKNMHEPGRLLGHLWFSWVDAVISLLTEDSPERANFRGWWRANGQVIGALRSRWRARTQAAVTDTEAFRRPLPGYFRDRFAALPRVPARPQVLFLSPYAICPPVHGGGVFMYQTLREMVKHADVHLICLLDDPQQLAEQEELRAWCRTTQFIVRLTGRRKVLGSIQPHAVVEFDNDELRWLIHRQIYLHQVDVMQIEYTNMGQYGEAFQRLPVILFEHDIYFQSIARALPGIDSLFQRASATLEYLRALRFELALLPRMDRVQVCTGANRDYLRGFLPTLDGRIDDGLRAGIDTARYAFQPGDRQPDTMLFLGSFRHVPNLQALEWFVRDVLPRVLAQRPQARLVVVGSDPPPRHTLPSQSDAIDLRGFVEEVREPLAECALFVCPILTGSGVRVKLLEAFAAGIPVVSTRIGAEGLADQDGTFCRLADDPQAFADAVVALLEDPSEAAAMAKRARHEVEQHWDMAVITRRLVESYELEIARKRQL